MSFDYEVMYDVGMGLKKGYVYRFNDVESAYLRSEARGVTGGRPLISEDFQLHITDIIGRIIVEKI